MYKKIMNYPKVWVVVINRNWIDDTIECIESILVNDFYENLEIVLVDNWSLNNEVVTLQKKFEWKIEVVAKSENEWFTWWVNAWIEYLSKVWVGYYLLLNNDAVIYNWLFQSLLKPMILDDTIWITGPLIKYYKKDIIWSNGGNIVCSLWIFISLDKWRKISERTKNINEKIKYISGCCMLIKKEVVENIWYIDHDYFAYCEDADYCVKAVNNWRKLHQNDSIVVEHKVSSSTKLDEIKWIGPFKAYLCARNSILFAKKNLTWFTFFLFVFNQFTTVFLYKLLFQIRNYKSLVAYIRWVFWFSYSKT